MTGENTRGIIKMTIENIRNEVEASKAASAWARGVKLYALDLIDSVPYNVEYGSVESLKADMLNGARDWKQYSWGGCSLIYDEDIAKRLCNPTELKRTKNGQKDPNPRERWLDTQARALYQAARLILDIANR
jgi:hypothetical protein